MPKRLTQEEFEQRARNVHGDKYDISHTVYKNKRTKVVVKCRIHGDFEIWPMSFLDGHGCHHCANKSQAKKMSKPKKDKEWLIKSLESLDDADKFDYSLIKEESFVYNGVQTELPIICKECGTLFKQIASSRLSGSGCNTCRLKKFSKVNTGRTTPLSERKKVEGIGIVDVEGVFSREKIYCIWREMIKRCYGKVQQKRPTYKGCKICDEWILFSNYKKWYEEHCVEGFDVDKDLLGGKLYSPETCCFLPPEINAALCSTKNNTRDLPTGVYMTGGCITACVGRKYLGTFKTVKEAQRAYIKEKKIQIDSLAEKWKDKLEPKAYNALKNLDIVKHFNL